MKRPGAVGQRVRVRPKCAMSIGQEDQFRVLFSPQLGTETATLLPGAMCCNSSDKYSTGSNCYVRLLDADRPAKAYAMATATKALIGPRWRRNLWRTPRWVRGTVWGRKPLPPPSALCSTWPLTDRVLYQKNVPPLTSGRCRRALVGGDGPAYGRAGSRRATVVNHERGRDQDFACGCRAPRLCLPK